MCYLIFWNFACTCLKCMHNVVCVYIPFSSALQTGLSICLVCILCLTASHTNILDCVCS